jgi:hypothetical protein
MFSVGILSTIGGLIIRVGLDVFTPSLWIGMLSSLTGELIFS